LVLLSLPATAVASDPEFAPRLPSGRAVVTHSTDAFLSRPEGLDPAVDVATTHPEMDFLYYSEQDYPGNPWSVWGDGLAADGEYYSAIGSSSTAGRPRGTGSIPSCSLPTTLHSEESCTRSQTDRIAT
jgi:hypothetical protein